LLHRANYVESTRFGRRGANLHNRARGYWTIRQPAGAEAHGTPNAAEPWSNGVRATVRRDIDALST